MARRCSVRVPPPKQGFVGNHWGNLEKHLEAVPDHTSVTVTQQRDGGVSFLVISSKDDSVYSSVETLVCGTPGTRRNSADALSFEIPTVRSSLVFEAYYSGKKKERGGLTFSW